MQPDNIRKRFILPVVCFSIVLAGIVARLVYLQGMNNFWKTRANISQKTISEISERGRIYDNTNTVLAESISVWDIAVLKKQLKQPDKEIKRIAEVLDLPAATVYKIKKAKGFFPLFKGADVSVYEKAVSLKSHAISIRERKARYYPAGDLAKETLGLIGITEEGKPEKGLSGIELIYNDYLQGTTQRRKIVRDSRGNSIYKNQIGESTYPEDIYLTIDKNIQFFVQESLSEMAQKTQSPLGMAIVQETDTGNILAMASYPENPQRLTPVEWVYEPGSTFKSITLAALLDTDTVREKDVVFCENGLWRPSEKVKISDHEPEGTLTVTGVLEKSSNIGTGKLALKLGLKNFYLYVKLFGFGMKTGLGFPGESAGIVKKIDNYTNTDLIVSSYGHGIAVTPLHIVTAYSALINGGLLYKPQVVKKITTHEGEIIKDNSPELVRRVIKPETSKRVKDILLSVVDNGTGKSAAIPGYKIGGKTGTANKIDPKTGKYLKGKNVASFCGFFPYEKPKYTVLVVMDNPRTKVYGSESAAPVFKEIAKRILAFKAMLPDRE